MDEEQITDIVFLDPAKNRMKTVQPLQEIQLVTTLSTTKQLAQYARARE